MNDKTVTQQIWMVVLLGLTAACANAEVTYQLEFDGQWSAASHPGAFPGSSAHFTRLVGGLHSAAVTFWEEGGLATPGIESVAEVGGTNLFLSEVQTAIDNGYARSTVLTSSLFSLPNSTTETITVEESHPLITLASMIAPSPDWFVGVSGLALRENGQWLGRVEVDLHGYDAGTEEGMGFSLSNAATVPKEPIARITSGPLSDQPPLATLTLTVQSNGLAGDFNLDRRVDDADALLWHTGYGNYHDGSATVVDGDANGDGQVRGDDFLRWQENHGMVLGSSTAFSPVPEASTIALLLVGSICLLPGWLRTELAARA